MCSSDLTLASPPKAGGIIELDRIVAVVNNEVITLNDLNDRMATVVAQLKKQGTQLPPIDLLKKQLLDRMVLDLVEIQEAKERGIKRSEEEREGKGVGSRWGPER